MRRHSRLFVAAVVLAVVLPVGLSAVVPQDLGFVSPDQFFEVSVDAGEQFFPQVEGHLAVYEEATAFGWRIGYYDFFTGNRGFIPQPSGIGVSDYFARPSNGRIIFSREEFGPASVQYSVLVFDTHSGAVTEVRRVEGAYFLQGDGVSYSAIGADTVAFFETRHAVPAGELFVARLNDLGSGAVRLTYDTDADPRIEFPPSVSPSGDVIVWTSCTVGITACDIEKATLSGTVWSVSRIATNTHRGEWARTDGHWITYPRSGLEPLSTDICWQPVAGGAEQCLELPGSQEYPTVAGGAIVFNSVQPGEWNWDIFAYQISTNRLFQITSTPDTELLTDVTVLADGRLRIVWDSGVDAQRNVYGADFTLPPVNSFSFGGFLQPIDPYPAFNVMKAGAAVPVRFSLGGFRGLDIFAADFPKSAPTTCGSASLEAPVDETVSAGNSALSYDAKTDTYTYVWKTERAWAGSCRQLAIRLTDDSTQYANFKFK